MRFGTYMSLVSRSDSVNDEYLFLKYAFSDIGGEVHWVKKDIHPDCVDSFEIDYPVLSESEFDEFDSVSWSRAALDIISEYYKNFA